MGISQNYVIQWVVAVLLGAKNIEQSKLLNYRSLNLILEQPIKNLHQQRTKLKEYASASNIKKLLQVNAKLVGVNKETDFYYDPHTKHYTGLRKILKSWCSKIRIADKVINTDFIHSYNGLPVYLNNGDTFEDMRVRFFDDVKQFREIAEIPDDIKITICVDRGIFSHWVFDEIIKRQNLHIVTWEKGYNQDMWNNQATTKNGTIIKERNNKTDTKLIKYQYQEYSWSKNSNIRQIIVRLPEKSGDGFIEVSILTDDYTRKAVEIINLILKRWLQENNFKYLIAHFGLDQITSYLFDEYKDIDVTKSIEEKQHISGVYKALTKELEKLRRKLKTVLHKRYEYEIKFGLYQVLSDLIKKPTNELLIELTAELPRIKNEKSTNPMTEKQKESYKKNLQQIVELTTRYQEVTQERNETSKETSKLKELIDDSTQKLNTAPKQYMDIIKIIAYNIFNLSIEPFKELYNNYRDDHVLFRNLVRSHGNIEWDEENMFINIIPTMEIEPKVRNCFSQILAKTNEMNPVLLNNSNQHFQLEITKKVYPFFAFDNLDFG